MLQGSKYQRQYQIREFSAILIPIMRGLDAALFPAFRGTGRQRIVAAYQSILKSYEYGANDSRSTKTPIGSLYGPH